MFAYVHVSCYNSVDQFQLSFLLKSYIKIVLFHIEPVEHISYYA
jgi:hypothetical protein